MRYTTKLLPSRSGNVGVLTLNNPKALHALTMDMIYCFQDVFREWEKDNTNLKAILLKSSKAKRPAFCSGGDVKNVYESGFDPQLVGTAKASEFFYEEYKVNHTLATSSLPIISFWDGVVMGGGVGISIHGKYRIATENTVFAMPETAIGLFPDVGSMYWMNQLLQRPIANYLALLGQRIYAADLLYTGLATHYVPSNQLSNLELALVEASSTNDDKADDDGKGKDDIAASILMSFHENIDTNDCFLATHKEQIDRIFQEDTVEQMVTNLEKEISTSGEDANPFAQKTLDSLLKLSPTSLKITLEGLQRGSRYTNIGETLQMEYRMACGCIRQPELDFFAGVRAVLIDRDNTPKWNPSKLEHVTPTMVNEYFDTVPPSGQDWVIPPKSKL